MSGEIGKGKERAETLLVVFRLGCTDYGLPFFQVEEVALLGTMTKLSNTPGFIEGVIKLHGMLLPLIDLKKRFSLPSGNTVAPRVLVVKIAGCQLGLIVDELFDLLQLPAEQIMPPPAVIAGIADNYLRGVANDRDRMIIILELSRLLIASEREQLRTGQGARRLADEICDSH